jgi:hypothetical protein
MTGDRRGAGLLSLGMKRPGREADHFLPPSTEVTNTWSYNHERLHGCKQELTSSELLLPVKATSHLGHEPNAVMLTRISAGTKGVQGENYTDCFGVTFDMKVYLEKQHQEAVDITRA